jgi:hypothetical protein
MKRGAVLVLSFLVACGEDPAASPSDAGADAGPPDPLPPPGADEGVQFAFDTVAPANTEVWKCLVGPIPTERRGFLPFNRVESKQSVGVHHMDLAILASTDIEPGLYDCDALYAEYPGLMDEIIIYASQSGEQELTLPPGTVANVPTGVQTMLELHYVNTTDVAQDVFTRINAYWIPDEEVTDFIWGQAIRDRNLHIPAGGTADEWTRCVMSEDIDLLVISTHTHALAQKTEVYAWNGSERGELLYTNENWQTPLLLDLTQRSLTIKKGEGFEFHCHYQNPGSVDVAWGFKAADEMCNLAIVYTPGDSTIQCNAVETSDGLGLDP